MRLNSEFDITYFLIIYNFYLDSGSKLSIIENKGE